MDIKKTWYHHHNTRNDDNNKKKMPTLHGQVPKSRMLIIRIRKARLRGVRKPERS